MSLTFQFCGLSDIGVVRPNNEDVWMARPEAGFFALADGMGGHLAGEIAAQETVEHLEKIFTHRIQVLTQKKKKAIESQEIMRIMHMSIESANQRVYQMSKQRREYAGMGTTLCCLYWSYDSIVYAHVGDSRIYRWRNQELNLLTKDHSLLTKWMAMGKKAENCKTPYPYKHVITRAVGTHPISNPEIAVCSYEPDDLFLLCTDGLTDVLSAEEIQQILCQQLDLKRTADHLIQQSKFKGSSDNITVLIVQCAQADDTNLFRQQLNNGLRSPRP